MKAIALPKYAITSTERQYNIWLKVAPLAGKVSCRKSLYKILK